MVNTAKIKGRIVEKEKTIQAIAPKIPCSPYTLGQKIANETPINLEEVMVLCDELDIKELIKLTEPLRNYISEKYDMKVSILVNCDEVKVIRDEAGVPIKKED